MRFDDQTPLDYILALNTKPVTAQELWNASYAGSLNEADTGFKAKYERLAAAINDILRMYT